MNGSKQCTAKRVVKRVHARVPLYPFQRKHAAICICTHCQSALIPALKQLVGVESLGSNAGDKMKMCEDALERLKAELASTKEHKTRITVDVSLEGIRIMEEKSRKLLYSHKVHQLVFIAFDVKV